MSGGVGEDERTALDALSNQFNLRLLFAMQGSVEYLSSVQVNIQRLRDIRFHVRTSGGQVIPFRSAA